MPDSKDRPMAAEAETQEKDPHALSDALRTFFEEKYKNHHDITNENYRTAMGNVESALEGNPNVMRLDHHKMKDPNLMKELIADNRRWDPKWTEMLTQGQSREVFNEMTELYLSERTVGTTPGKSWLPVFIMEEVEGIHMPALYIIKANAPDVTEVTSTMKLFQHQIEQSLPEDTEEEESPEQRVAA